MNLSYCVFLQYPNTAYSPPFSVCLFTVKLSKLSKNAQMAKKVHLSHLKDAQLSVEMFIDCFDCEKLHDLSIHITGLLEKLER